MQYVLVTGAYGGMGKATVQALKNSGYFVFALDKKVEQAEENVLPIQVDLTDEVSVQNAFHLVHGITQELFAILHFAGIYALDSLVEMPSEAFARAFEINVFGAFQINKTFFPLLKKGSKIIITSSELAPLDPLPFTSVYSITKSALDKYALSLRMELQLLDISVSVLRPGAVKTDMLGVSTTALDKFCENTKLYSCNAERFKKIVDSVEARHIPTEKIASLAMKILKEKKAKPVYQINRNPLLILLNILPLRLQNFIIKQILK